MTGNRQLVRAGAVALALFLAAYAVDFARDVASRDCFSWMDPEQYYSFALSLLDGSGGGARGFEVASAFPYLVAPFLLLGGKTIPAALGVNLLAALLLAASVTALARALEIRLPAALPVLLVLGSPLLVGLSRELYVELTLTALVAVGYVLWFRTDRLRKGGPAVLFALLLAAGLLVKMTFLVFFAGPFVIEGAGAIRTRDIRRAARLAAVFLLPPLAVFGGIRIFFPDSFAYYASLGNTRIPIMRLIGPPDLLSIGSIVYPFAETARTGLGLLSVFLAAPAVLARRLFAGPAGSPGERFRVLALWLLLPLVLFMFQAVKEPRHAAPVAVPAVLLVLGALQRVRRPRLRGLLLAAAAFVSIGQYLALTRGAVFCPYRLAAALDPTGIEETMVRADPEKGPMRMPDGRLDINRWRFTRSLALSGFDRNEALALAWHFSPAVVYDLDLPQWSEEDARAFERFEDLFYFAALNSYNARCGWPRFYFTLERSAVARDADFVLVKGDGEDARGELAAREVVGAVGREGEIRVLAPLEPSARSFRDLYARDFLRRSSPADPRELNTIYFSLFMGDRLAGRETPAAELLDGFPPSFRPGRERRNVFWIAHDHPLQAFVAERYPSHLREFR
ncbi:MAG: hypothetical protein ABIH26_06685 [Candidatus Eisenbacteria bacterium]